MKLLLVLLALAAVLVLAAGTARAQSIDLSQVRTAPIPATPAAAPAASAKTSTLQATLSPNWARVTASHDAQGQLVARCTIEPNPLIAALHRNKNRTNQPHRK